MAFMRPTLSELVTRIEADYTSRLTGGGTLLRRAVVKVFARVHAGAMHLIYGYVAYVARQVMPDTAEQENLERWCRIWGVYRKAATYAERDATFTGTDGTLIPAGTELVRDDGVIYLTFADATPSGGSVTTLVTAKLAGTGGNIDTGTILALSSPIAGITSEVTIESTNSVDGVDQELDAPLLARLLDRIQNPPHGGSLNDYKTWALEVSGVTRAWVYSNYLGNGTVALAFVRDGDTPSIIPSVGEVQEVQDYIDDPSRRPVTADFTAFAPIADVLDFTIDGISDLVVRAAIVAELTDLIMREGEPAGTLYLSRINEAISKAQGEEDHVLVSPVANVISATGHIPVMGTVTWL